MDEDIAVTPAVAQEDSALETGSLAREMVDAYADQLAYHRQRMERARDGEDVGFDPPYEDSSDRLLDTPPEEVSWFDLAVAAERDPARFEVAWERIKAAARAELDSGHRAARALSPSSRPWERAQFLAIRQGFVDEWQPRGGIERALLETMAQAHTAQLEWLARLHSEARMEALSRGRSPARGGPGEPPRLAAAAATEQAAAMADRFNRLFLRTLRALRDLRRYGPAVVVQGSAQINVAERQVNVHRASRQVAGDVGGVSPVGDPDGMS